jgi:hypothetical protein
VVKGRRQHLKNIVAEKIFKFLQHPSSMNLSLGARMVVKQDVVLTMKLPFETEGDLHLLSLHRIKSRISQLPVANNIRDTLINRLLEENAEYRRELKKDWYCITGNHLDSAVYDTMEHVQEIMDAGIKTVDDSKRQDAVRKVMIHHKEQVEGTIRQWFDNRYDELFYDTSGQIPFAIVRRLRRDLHLWALGSNPFGSPIEDIIDEAAKEVGMPRKTGEHYQDLWERMGGRLYKME